MPSTYTHNFDTSVFKGEVTVNTGLFIGGQFVDSVEQTTIDVIAPVTGEKICNVAVATKGDVDIAVKTAREAFNTSWGLKANGTTRARLLNKLADLLEVHANEISALEALDSGKTFRRVRHGDLIHIINCIRYFAGWADKVQGNTIETSDAELVYTRREPIGVVGQIIPWNFPLLNISWKIAPALATGNTIVLKPSEFTPLSALYLAELTVKAGFPPGVINIINGVGPVAGQAISEHPEIDKLAFTGSTRVGREIFHAAGGSNLKNITLELGGKSPSIVFDDCELEQTVDWTVHGIYFNSGQVCSAGSRIYVHANIYDRFLELLTEKVKALRVGDPFIRETYQGPMVSQVQMDRVLGYIEEGKKEGATLHVGGERIGSQGYFIQPTVFTNCTQDMKIVREEIFGPVAVLIKFTDEEEVVRMANDTVYGLAAGVFSLNIKRALSVAHRLEAGTVGVNMINIMHWQAPFGGFKQSGMGRELGEEALRYYTSHKSLFVNIALNPPSTK